MNSALKPVSHVMFDLDGLLLNTEDLYTEATSHISEQYGIPYTWETKVKVMGKTKVDAAKMIIDDLGLPMTVEEYLTRIDEEYARVFPQSKLLPGVKKLIEHLHNSGVPTAIATSSSKSSFDLKVANHQEFISLFDHVVLGSSDPEVKEGKPAPDIFLVCASRFKDKPSPDKVLVFEDAPNGVEAAVAAGMQVVMIPDPRLKPEQSSKATLVLKSMEEFQPELFGLPPYPK